MSEGPNPPPDLRRIASLGAGEDLQLREFARILVERRGVVLTCLLATVVVTAVVTFLSIPRYRATATLQIERRSPEILTFKDVLSVDSSYQGYEDFYQTQYKLIQSRTVLRRAAERMDLLNRPEYVNRPVPPLARLLQWPVRLLGRADESGDGTNALAAAAGFIEGNLSVLPVRNSHLVRISFVDRDAELARDVANAVSDAYQQFNLEARYTTTEQASEFLTKEVARLQSEIAQRERQLQEYGTEKALLALSDGTADISERALADLNSRLIDAKGRLAVANARHEKVQQAAPESLPEVLASPLINHLKQEYAGVERRYSQLAERFKPGWPELAQLQEELQQARERLEIETTGIAHQVREGARNAAEQIRAEVANLELQVETQKREVQRVNRDAIDYASLKAEIDTRRKVLSELVARQSETESSGQLRDARASNIRVVDPAATPLAPVHPRKVFNLALSVVFGLALGAGLAFVLHYVDNTIKTEQDVERYGGRVAVLGHVPLFEQLRLVYGGKKSGDAVLHDPAVAPGTQVDPDLASHSAPRSAFAEAFKNLRTSLLLASPDHPPRTIQVTSCEPRDGKSTVAINLAIVLTQTGKRVLLVDSDLRRPRLHRALGLANDAGLSSYLTGNAELEEMFQETSVPRLDVVTSGPVPPNPSELLGSPRLSSLVENLERGERYGHVVFDSPPVIQVADSVVLAAKMDATILVVRAAATVRESLSQGVARLRQGRAKLVGALLNAVAERSGYYRRYGYYRHHGEDDSEPGAMRGPSGKIAALSRRVRRGRRRQAG